MQSVLVNFKSTCNFKGQLVITVLPKWRKKSSLGSAQNEGASITFRQDSIEQTSNVHRAYQARVSCSLSPSFYKELTPTDSD